jgi:Flp pilus assembly protein TadB
MVTAVLVTTAALLLLGVIKIPTLTIVRASQSDYVDEIDWMRGFIDALRSGATAREALSYTNLNLVPTTKAVLQQQGEVGAALTTDAIERNSLLLKALAACWQVSQQHGAPLSPAMQSALTAQLDRIAIAEEIRSQLAGPKTAGLTLALLPVATLLMAQLIGIPALGWLIGSAAGFGVLIVGTSLLIAGSWVMHKLASNIERELQL